MNLRQIEIFRALMQGGSVTEAARRLHVSQPGISRALSHIELQLGLRLFDRRRGKLRPTPEAETLFCEVEQVYRGVARIDQCVSALQSGDLLSLRVLASPSTGLEMVPRALTALGRAFPAARFQFEILPAREMEQRLAAREADIAISTLPLEHPLLEAQRIGRWTVACVVPRGHAFERRRLLKPADILGQTIIAFGADTPQGRIVADWCTAHGVAQRAQIEVRAGQTACALVASGAGIAVVDDLTARACMTGQLAFRPIAQAPAFDIFAVGHAQFAPSRLAERFVEETRRALRKRGSAPSAA